MIEHGLSGSYTPLWFRCSWWARADVFSTLPKREHTNESRYGSAFHELAEAEGDVDEDPASEDRATLLDQLLDDALEDLMSASWIDGDAKRFGDICKRWGLDQTQVISLAARYDIFRMWWRTFKPELRWSYEVPLAYDTRTGKARLIAKAGGHRDYSSCKNSEIPLTIDAVAIDNPNRMVHVLDFKTGRDADPAHRSMQLRMGALAATTLASVTRATVYMIKVTDQTVDLDQARLDDIDLQGFETRLNDRFKAMPTSEPTPGPHCSSLRCPARTLCPAGQNAVFQIAPSAAKVYPLIGPFKSSEHIAHALGIKAIIGAFSKALADRVHRAVADGGGRIELPDGSVLEPRTIVSRTIRPSMELLGAVQKELGVDLMPHTTLTKTGLVQAFKLAGASPQEIVSNVNRVLHMAGEMGLVTQKSSVRHGPHKQGKSQK